MTTDTMDRPATAQRELLPADELPPNPVAAAAAAAAGKAGTAPAPAPTYSPEDDESCRRINAWLAEQKQSRAWLAKRARLSSGTVSQLLARKYPSPPGDMLRQMLAVLSVEAERLGDGTPGYVEGSVHKLCFVVCDRTRKHANFGVLMGAVGVGKTRTLREYEQRKPHTLMVEANPMMLPGSLLAELLERLNVPVPKGLDAKFAAVVKALAGTTYLLLVDEAENCSPQALHYLRRIRDKAGVGVVLAGTEKLASLIKPLQGQFDQIRSRVSMWPATMQRITEDDAHDIARQALADHLPPGQQVSDAVLQALWEYCGGSARMLTESLIPGLRDYVIGRTELTAGAVDRVATTVLFLAKRSGSKA